jgi:putative transposase
MGYPPRYRLPGVPQHVVQRGHNRRPIFVHSDDLGFYRATLYEVAAREGVAVYAYALMTNHVHLLVCPENARSIERCMQALNRRYGLFVNARHARSGTLWERRYRASVVQSERHLSACHVYIDLNPVRAGMVKRPEEYEWSSARHYVLGGCDPLVTDSPAFLALAGTLKRRTDAYRALLGIGIDDALLATIRAETRRGGVLGSARFRAEIESMLRVRLPGAPRGRPRKRATENRI